LITVRMSSALMRVKLRVKSEYSSIRCARNLKTSKLTLQKYPWIFAAEILTKRMMSLDFDTDRKLTHGTGSVEWDFAMLSWESVCPKIAFRSRCSLSPTASWRNSRNFFCDAVTNTVHGLVLRYPMRLDGHQHIANDDVLDMLVLKHWINVGNQRVRPLLGVLCIFPFHADQVASYGRHAMLLLCMCLAVLCGVRLLQ